MVNILACFRYLLEGAVPVLVKSILDWFQLQADGAAEMSEGYYYALLLMLYSLVRSYSGMLADYICESTNVRITNDIRVYFFIRDLNC